VYVLKVAHGGPQEAHQLPGHSYGGDLGSLALADTVEEPIEAVLSLPGMGDDLWRLTVLPLS
jgi:hypothetical protein